MTAEQKIGIVPRIIDTQNNPFNSFSNEHEPTIPRLFSVILGLVNIPVADTDRPVTDPPASKSQLAS